MSFYLVTTTGPDPEKNSEKKRKTNEDDPIQNMPFDLLEKLNESLIEDFKSKTCEQQANFCRENMQNLHLGRSLRPLYGCAVNPLKDIHERTCAREMVEDAAGRQQLIRLPHRGYDIREKIEELTIDVGGLRRDDNLFELKFPNLKRIRLFGNFFDDNDNDNILAGIGTLTSLNALTFDDNDINLTEPLRWIGNLTNLQTLYLGHLERQEIFADEIGELKNLRSLSFSCRFDDAEDEERVLTRVANLKSLEVLNMSLNRPVNEWIGEMTNLRDLSVDGSYLRNLQCLEKLTSLRVLTLIADYGETSEKTELQGGDSIGNLTSLQHLVVSDNEFSSLPDSIGNLKNLRSLDVSDSRLTSLPDSIGDLPWLTKLDISTNRFLGGVPSQIRRLTTLRELNISSLANGDGGLEIPSWIGDLTGLQSLDMHQNKIKDLPTCIENLTDLRDLEISSNPLTRLPDWVGKLSKLEKLSFSGTEIDNLPDWIGNLTDLKHLTISAKTFHISPNITKLKNLKRFFNY